LAKLLTFALISRDKEMPDIIYGNKIPFTTKTNSLYKPAIFRFRWQHDKAGFIGRLTVSHSCLYHVSFLSPSRSLGITTERQVVVRVVLLRRYYPTRVGTSPATRSRDCGLVSVVVWLYLILVHVMSALSLPLAHYGFSSRL
jgi:hypothetical protein